MLTLNEQRNLRSIYQMHETRYLFKFFFHSVKFFSKNILLPISQQTPFAPKSYGVKGREHFSLGKCFITIFEGK